MACSNQSLVQKRENKVEEPDWLSMICTLVGIYQGRFGEFSLDKIKIAFKGIKQSAGSPSSPTKLVVQSFRGQSTATLLCSFLVQSQNG